MISRALPSLSSLSLVLVLTAAPAEAQDAWPGASWPTAVPETVGFDSSELAIAVNSLNGNVFVAKSGYRIAQKGDVAKKYALYSVGKSITALVFGRLVQEGKVNLDDVVPGSVGASGESATYREFLAMRSDFGLTPHAPGQNHAYNNYSVHHYGEQIRSHYPGQNQVAILDSALYSTLGRQDPTGFGGLWSGWGGGFDSSARDIARIGLLLLRDGKWKTQQLVPKSFVDALYLNQIPSGSNASSSTGGSPTQGPPGNNWWNQFAITAALQGNYSYGWWTNASGLYPGIPLQTLWADGLNGHRIIVCPEKDLVVTVTYGGDDQSPEDILAPILGAEIAPPPAGVVGGEAKVWHEVTVTFDGPFTSESAVPNPFRDYRLDVTFTHGGTSLTVPGFFAADGDAANTGATSGNKWRVRFTPPEAGEWTYVASFRTGPNIAISTDPFAGDPTGSHGATGVFSVEPSDATGRDFRGHGTLRHVGERYLRFAGTDEAFLKGGAASPENLLAYQGFDQTPPTHQYAPHASDWLPGDPDWGSGAGKNIIGALNYLASTGVNSVGFLTMNAGGDGDDVWPWTQSGAIYRYDCSKLDQWEIVFDHMTALGLQLHVVTQEAENDQLLDGGALGLQRALYYRELIARFAHHPALVWNLGDENTNSDAERKEFAAYFEMLDAYDHPIVVHTFPSAQGSIYNPLLGFAPVDGPSLHMGSLGPVHDTTKLWIELSANAGHPWFVCLDEIGPASDGVVPDAVDATHDGVRTKALWGNLMAGGAGVAWTFGDAYEHDDLDCEDWRSRDAMWTQTDTALRFFRDHLPFDEMTAADERTLDPTDYVFAKGDDLIAVYLPAGGAPTLDFGAANHVYTVRWFDPRNGGPLRLGSKGSVLGYGAVSLGLPPEETSSDWLVLVERATDFAPTYGEGVVGYAGEVPAIAGSDPTLDGGVFAVTLDGARPGNLAFCVVGRNSAEKPYYAGSIWNDHSVGLFPFVTDGIGHAQYALTLPPIAEYVGRSLYFQWIVAEQDAPQGIALSQGLQAVLHF